MSRATWGEFLADRQTLLLAGLSLLVVALYVLRSVMRRASEEPLDLSKVGEITLEELAKYSGVDPFRATLLAVRGTIFDVSSGRDFYGPSAPPRACAAPPCLRLAERRRAGCGAQRARTRCLRAGSARAPWARCPRRRRTARPT